jgi:hypothetical protein
LTATIAVTTCPHEKELGIMRHPWPGAIRLVICAILAAATFAAGAPGVLAQAGPGDCLSADEAELAQLINDYRAQRGLAPVPVSRSLSAVAQWHVWDLVVNHPYGGSCNLHSWSAGDIWSEVCYTDDHANASGMWIKPREITGGVYTGAGYEIAASGVSSPAGALNLWKRSSAHNDVILNNGVWASYDPWPAMGIGMRGGYAVVWFGSGADPQGTIAVCGAASGVADEPPAPPAAIADAHPNPFNPRVTLTVALAQETPLTLQVYDVRGRPVATLLRETRGPGSFPVQWDGRAADGRDLPSGVYFAVLTTPAGVSRQKLALLR